MSPYDPAAAADVPLSALVDLSGKVAIVTGAAMGLGFDCAARLAEAGAAVLLADVDEGALASAASTLEARGRKVATARADVTSRAAVEAMLAAALAAFGRVDILVNNAGIYPQRPFFDGDSDEAFWNRVFDVNVNGTMLCTQVVGRKLREQGQGGSIVNIASIAAIVAHPDFLTIYSATKAAVCSLTRVLAKALAPDGIRMNAVLPGGMVTPGTGGGGRTGADIPVGYRAYPDEVARAVLFLASDLGLYVTGAELVVDGGASLVG